MKSPDLRNIKNHKERPPKKRENRRAASRTINSSRGGVEGLMILNHKGPIHKCQITNELYIAHNNSVTDLYIVQAKSFRSQIRIKLYDQTHVVVYAHFEY
jgi:hypothetical protein